MGVVSVVGGGGGEVPRTSLTPRARRAFIKILIEYKNRDNSLHLYTCNFQYKHNASHSFLYIRERHYTSIFTHPRYSYYILAQFTVHIPLKQYRIPASSILRLADYKLKPF